MCVAAIIHKPVTLKYMRCMDEDNPHGAGVAWLDGGRLRFHRGINVDVIYAMQEAGVLTYPYLMHYRWATHGDPIPQLTHPFPTGIRAFGGELHGVADEVIIHNGVWNDCVHWCDWLPDSVPAEVVNATSDTAIAAYFYSEYPEIGDEIPWSVASASVSAEGQLLIRKHGSWSSYEGNEYSNLKWLPYGAYCEHYSRRSWYPHVSGGWTWDDWSDYTKVPASSSEALGKDDGWEEYVRARYGDEVAAAISATDPDTEDDAELMARLTMAEDDRSTLEELEFFDGDMISDDPATVNRWLASKTTRDFLAKKGA